MRYRAGLVGKKILFFDGVDDYLYVADSLYDFLNPYTITVELLVTPSRASGFFSILRLTPDVAGPNHMIALFDGRVDVCHPDDTRTQLTVSIPKRWTHIVIRYGVGKVYDVWLDGELHASSTDFTKEMKYWKYPSYFAMFRPGDPRYFLGEWGIIRIYNRVLSEDEIRRLKNDAFNLRPASIRDGLVLELLPDTLDCTNGVWRDNSGNGNHGTIYGAKCIAV